MRTQKNPPLIAVARQLVDQATKEAFNRMVRSAAASRSRSRTQTLVKTFNEAMRERLAWLEESERAR